jgi:flagella basal body P-ring formation protein FlgA
MSSFKTLALAVIGMSIPVAAAAAPVLRADVTVVSGVVTVGDMFEDAGALADAALFRAPQPGTSGTVGLAAIRAAARSVGLTEFGAEGIANVRVERATTIVDAPVLTDLIATELGARGIVHEGIVIRAAFDAAEPSFNAEAVVEPAQLQGLSYASGTGEFTARFRIVGMDHPVVLTGRIDLLVEAPHLVDGRRSGAVLGPNDIEMRLVPLKYAEASGVATLDQLVGKELRRQSRSGLLLSAADVDAPKIVKRNSLVTVVLRSGALTLTAQGQALNHASVGEPVQVLNSVTRKILHGVATAQGAVEMTGTLSLAGL